MNSCYLQAWAKPGQSLSGSFQPTTAISSQNLNQGSDGRHSMKQTQGLMFLSKAVDIGNIKNMGLMFWFPWNRKKWWNSVSTLSSFPDRKSSVDFIIFWPKFTSKYLLFRFFVLTISSSFSWWFAVGGLPSLPCSMARPRRMLRRRRPLPLPEPPPPSAAQAGPPESRNPMRLQRNSAWPDPPRAPPESLQSQSAGEPHYPQQANRRFFGRKRK